MKYSSIIIREQAWGRILGTAPRNKVWYWEANACHLFPFWVLPRENHVWEQDSSQDPQHPTNPPPFIYLFFTPCRLLFRQSSSVPASVRYTKTVRPGSGGRLCFPEMFTAVSSACRYRAIISPSYFPRLLAEKTQTEGLRGSSVCHFEAAGKMRTWHSRTECSRPCQGPPPLPVGKTGQSFPGSHSIGLYYPFLWQKRGSHP